MKKKKALGFKSILFENIQSSLSQSFFWLLKFYFKRCKLEYYIIGFLFVGCIGREQEEIYGFIIFSFLRQRGCAVLCLVSQLCPTCCNPVDCKPGFLCPILAGTQAGYYGMVHLLRVPAEPRSRGKFFTSWAPREISAIQKFPFSLNYFYYSCFTVLC